MYALPPRQYSVVIPFRGRLDQLEQTLRSLAAANHDHREIILVDDASGQELAGLCEKYGARLVVLPTHRGPSVARNTGARHARFEWLVFVDADICVPPDCFDQFDHFLENQNMAIGSCPIARHTPTDSFFSRYADEFFRFSILSQAQRMLFTACCVVPANSFNQAGGFDESAPLAFADDIVMGWRLAELGCTFALVETVEVTHLKTMSVWGFIRSRVLHAYYQAAFHSAYHRRSGPPTYRKPTGPMSALIIAAFIACAVLWPSWLAFTTPVFLTAFLAVHAAFLGFLVREQGLFFTGLAASVLLAQYCLYTAAAAVGKLARLGERVLGRTPNKDGPDDDPTPRETDR